MRSIDWIYSNKCLKFDYISYLFFYFFWSKTEIFHYEQMKKKSLVPRDNNIFTESKMNTPNILKRSNYILFSENKIEQS